MVRTTPDRLVDVEVAFPFLVGRARWTERLHPRSGAPLRSDSSMGGEFAWPSDVAWPHCDGHATPTPMIPVLQLWARDVPGLPMRPGTDVLQMAWCPNRHDIWSDDDYGPRIAVFWHGSSRSDRATFSPPAPVSDVVEDHLVPRPCVLHPEHVREYPALFELSDEEQELATAGPEGDELDYFFRLGAAPGTKAGGWPSWAQDPDWPDCAIGHQMEHLLTIASFEYNDESRSAWLPVEDDAVGRDEIGPGILLGDGGDMYVFVCRQCDDWPITKRVQS